MNKHFLLIGPPKSGTTSVAHYLNQVPGIIVSKPKEPRFFELEFDRGYDYYLQKYFSRRKEGDLLVDCRPGHLMIPFVPERIKKTCPQAKVCMILRDPIDRAHSHWWMRSCKNREPLSFDDAMIDNLENNHHYENLKASSGPSLWKKYLNKKNGEISIRLYIEDGYYAEHLGRYLNCFDASQIAVIDWRSLKEYPEKVTSELLNWLGIPKPDDIDFTPQNTAEDRASTRNRFLLSRLITKTIGRNRELKTNGPLAAKTRGNINPETRSLLTDHYLKKNDNLDHILSKIKHIHFK